MAIKTLWFVIQGEKYTQIVLPRGKRPAVPEGGNEDDVSEVLSHHDDRRILAAQRLVNSMVLYKMQEMATCSQREIFTEAICRVKASFALQERPRLQSLQRPAEA